MIADSTSTTVRSLDRINLRLAGDTFAAIEERLARERDAPAPRDRERRAHG
jgi:hypothetical protein